MYFRRSVPLNSPNFVFEDGIFAYDRNVAPSLDWLGIGRSKLIPNGEFGI